MLRQLGDISGRGPVGGGTSGGGGFSTITTASVASSGPSSGAKSMGMVSSGPKAKNN